MKHKNDTLLDALTELIQSQQTHKNRKIAEVKESIRGIMGVHQKMMHQGREAYRRHGDAQAIDSIFEMVEQRINHIPEKFKANQDRIILIDEKDYFTLYRLLLSVFETENYTDAMNMAMVLTVLEPLRVQPYIILGSMLLHEVSAGEAAEFYKKIIVNFKDPLLYFYAADAHVQAGLKKDAKSLLYEAIELSKRLKLSEAKELKRGMEAYLQSL